MNARRARGPARRPPGPRAAAALVARARHQAELRQVYLGFVHRPVRRGTADRYDATVPVTGYPARRVTVEIERYTGIAAVYADGPNDSPHRYPDRNRHCLCIWYPHDPPSRRWTADDGLVALFAMAAAHLFKEAWWREHNEWLGDEAPHDPTNARLAA